MQQIAELTKPNLNPENKTGAAELKMEEGKQTEAIKAKLQHEINLFAQKIASLAAANQSYQQR